MKTPINRFLSKVQTKLINNINNNNDNNKKHRIIRITII